MKIYRAFNKVQTSLNFYSDYVALIFNVNIAMTSEFLK